MNLREALAYAWSRETSANPGKWSPENAALGQCAVTALVIQDYLGGTLMRCTVNGESHYWNEIAGRRLDWTIQQYGDGPLEITSSVARERSYVLSYSSTVARYHALKKSVVAVWTGLDQ